MDSDTQDHLKISGLQHYKFCRRQWALIHIEGLWAENYRTTDGNIMHEKAHDKQFFESRGDKLVVRGLQIVSHELKVVGECDVVEFRRSDGGISLPGREGTWIPYPVEYKRGSPNPETGNELQLCCQAMCLEEMLCCQVPEGALYFGEQHRRIKVPFTAELRMELKESLREMRRLYTSAHTPRAKPRKGCAACSLKELCLPATARRKSVSRYLREHLEESE